ncbi:PhzF family phenazine biosynthesis protein [Flammeovirgaceae bacterium SG7u.111]|nr:PhzF family phenazine biosynthesis protein [Flammeovirgaceae bacterium SG7u.132]WPO38356.1 PhzF family phenazine biosynthesis protein [Flammeovirgaceae bacterium SG7u.111]
MKIYYDQRVFRAKSNSSAGEVSGETVFEYFQRGTVLTGTYGGGSISQGQLLGNVNEGGSLSFIYQHLNAEGEFRTGKCESVPRLLADGLVELSEKWEWTSGKSGSGESVLEEFIPEVMKKKYFLLDVFTDRKFGGNQLAVFTNGGNLSGETMQKVAKELNLSETTFILPPESLENDYKVRIFTPGKELPTAGHPTLGTSHIIVSEKLKMVEGEKAELRLEQKVGMIPVDLELSSEGFPQRITMEAPLPNFLDIFEDVAQMAEVLNLQPSDIRLASPMQLVSCGVPFLIVPLNSLAAVENCKVNSVALEKYLADFPVTELLVFSTETVEGNSDVHCRMFAPEFGIVEDPATGSANGPLGSYLIEHEVFPVKEVNEFVSEQGFEMGRPSYLYLTIVMENDKITKVKVGGQSVIMGEGMMEIKS